MHIETERLIIRDFCREDWRDVFSYTSDPEVMRWIPEGVFDEEKAREFIAENMGEHAEKYAVVLKSENLLIGHMPFHKWFVPFTYEIGWVFNPNYHNRGYASEAAYALLKHGFETLKLHRIIATCQPQNPPSFKVMEKIGMRREGEFRQCIYRESGEWWDEFFYALLEEEWFRNRE